MFLLSPAPKILQPTPTQKAKLTERGMVGPLSTGAALPLPPATSVAVSTSTITVHSCKDPGSLTATRFLADRTTFSPFVPQKTLHCCCPQRPPLCRRSSVPPGFLLRLLGSSSTLGVARLRASGSRSSRTALGAMAAAGGGRKQALITFDVDGTLMQSTGVKANLLHKKAFSFAFKEVFGIDGTIDAIKHHGSTDPMVMIDTLAYYGIPTETATSKLPELKSKMVEYAKNNSTQVGEGLELLPGLAALLEILSKRKDVVVALVTGNLEDIGWLKMDGLGIRPFFSTPNFGGFGSDHVDRGELVKIAASRAKTFFPGDFSLCVHVGDTPNDIRAAESGGALAIGVCTGVFSRDDLLAASKSGTAVIFNDLKDSGVFLRACGLEVEPIE